MSASAHGECTVCKPGRVVTAAEADDPFTSKLGGLPAWHDAATAPSEPLCCRQCGQADKVLLVMQVYAPTDRARSLYIFCCNRRKCSLSPRGWTVIRNQASCPFPLSAEGEGVGEEEDAGPDTETLKGTTAAASSTWSFLEELDLGVKSVIATGESSSSIGINDLEQMLIDRDASLQQNRGGAKSKTRLAPGPTLASPTAAAAAVVIVSQEWRPSRRIVDIEDNWTGKSPKASKRIVGQGEGPGEEDEEDEEDEDGESSSSFHKSAASDAHVKRLLEGYLQDDPDDELVAMLRHGAGARAEGESESVAPSKQHGRRTREQDEDQGWVKKLTRSSAAAKAELYFQRRTAAEPQQVMRYAYAGEPLWCTHPPPTGSPSRCRCGAERCFELQLMPALLAQQVTVHTLLGDGASALQPESSSSSSAAAAASSTGPDTKAVRSELLGEEAEVGNQGDELVLENGDCDGDGDDDDDDDGDGDGNVGCQYAKPSELQIADLLQRLGDGLDFGVLTIWVCPDSCSQSIEEECSVQPPPDIV